MRLLELPRPYARLTLLSVGRPNLVQLKSGVLVVRGSPALGRKWLRPPSVTLGLSCPTILPVEALESSSPCSVVAMLRCSVQRVKRLFRWPLLSNIQRRVFRVAVKLRYRVASSLSTTSWACPVPCLLRALLTQLPASGRHPTVLLTACQHCVVCSWKSLSGRNHLTPYYLSFALG